MDSGGDGAGHRGTAASAAARVAPLAASPFRALGLGVQRQRIPRRRPLAPRPRHLRSHDYVAAVGQPLLRQKWPGLVAGVFPFSAAENLRIGAVSVATSNEAREKKRAEQEEMSDGGSGPLLIYSGSRPTSDPHDHR